MSLQRDLEHTRPGSRLVAGRNFLYSCSISLDVLFSCCISVDGCLPVDLLHCSCTTSPAAAVSSSLPAPTQHHQSIAQNSLFGLTHWYAMWYAPLSKLICFIRREFLKYFSSHTCTRVICQ